RSEVLSVFSRPPPGVWIPTIRRSALAGCDGLIDAASKLCAPAEALSSIHADTKVRSIRVSSPIEVKTDHMSLKRRATHEVARNIEHKQQWLRNDRHGASAKPPISASQGPSRF